MIRWLQWLNLAGVLALAVLCVAQWRANRQVNLELQRLESIRLEQAKKLDERDRTIAGHIRDLETLREHLIRVTGESKEAQAHLTAARREVEQLAVMRDQLKQSVTNWTQAVSARDERIREHQEQIRELAGRLSQTVARYNELTTNYNSAVALLNERAAAYNDLVTKYNELVKK